jgi:hypothetical protein
MLRRFQHPASTLIGSASTDEWVSRVSQWTNPAGNKDQDVP